MRTFVRIFVISLSLMISVSLCSLAAEEESPAVEKVDVPEAVMEAFAKDYPEMEIIGIEMEEIDGVTYYEIECGEGEMDVIYLADGSLYAVEQEIDVDSLAQAIADAIAASYPDGEIAEAEKITRGSETEYEVIIIMEEEDEDIAYEVIIGADGKVKGDRQILDEDEDDDDLDDSDVDYEEDED
ncbi:MAG: PepSY-like domain-containing protein [Candidatus Zixiibacteriota bacterium]|nr:MAG: PepSY-like domain-containing protein [candidate division Zixibacteria bacterium]